MTDFKAFADAVKSANDWLAAARVMHRELGRHTYVTDDGRVMLDTVYCEPIRAHEVRNGYGLLPIIDAHALTYHDESWRAMDETNYDAVVDGLETDTRWADDHLVPLREGYGLVAFPLTRRNVEHVVECLRSLEGYPLLDDDAYFSREWDAFNETVSENWHRWVADAYDGPGEDGADELGAWLTATNDPEGTDFLVFFSQTGNYDVSFDAWPDDEMGESAEQYRAEIERVHASYVATCGDPGAVLPFPTAV